ncbi:uncharacterized protein LOC130776656 [Actinidia eriantha]|uniref:uncharacterized protein LOC130776656 n=1 Tax=Actinidia eriantha TaxID=165200 RepID=UPI002585A2E6|nr:uncharacterized protein LOC130776656 [Actinidia eriantha]
MRDLMNTTMVEGTPVRDHVLQMARRSRKAFKNRCSSSSTSWFSRRSEKAQGQVFYLQAVGALEVAIFGLSSQIEQQRGSTKPASLVIERFISLGETIQECQQLQ